MVKSDDNFGLLKIIDARFKVGILHYPILLTTPKDDLLNQPKSSPVWQDIYESTIFRKY